MNVPNRQDFDKKCGRIRAYLDEQGYDAMLIGRRDCFAWLSFGGNNTIFRSSELGAAILVVRRDGCFLVAQTMDAARIMDEELCGLPIEAVPLKWNEETREQCALRIAAGRAVSDFPIPGATCCAQDIFQLQLPYFPWEIARYREVGALADRLMRQTADEVRPGMAERQIEALMLRVYAENGMLPDVVLVGGDERIARYRHPVPSLNVTGHTLMMHAAVAKWGMHANLTRMLCFADRVPSELERAYELANTCQAASFAALRPGMPFDRLLEERRRILTDAGCPNEYGLHYPGASTGYWIGSPDALLSAGSVRDTMCFDLFITVTGAKVEELAMAGASGAEVLSAAGHWPVKAYCHGLYRCDLPRILCK